MSFTFTSQTLLSFTFTSQTCMAWMMCGAQYEFQAQKLSALAHGRPQTISASYTCYRLQMSWSPHQVPAMSRLRHSTNWQSWYNHGWYNWCNEIGTNMDDTFWANQYGMTNQLCHNSGKPIVGISIHHDVLDSFSTRGPRTTQCGAMGFRIDALRRWIRYFCLMSQKHKRTQKKINIWQVNSPSLRHRPC